MQDSHISIAKQIPEYRQYHLSDYSLEILSCRTVFKIVGFLYRGYRIERGVSFRKLLQKDGGRPKSLHIQPWQKCQQQKQAHPPPKANFENLSLLALCVSRHNIRKIEISSTLFGSQFTYRGELYRVEVQCQQTCVSSLVPFELVWTRKSSFTVLKITLIGFFTCKIQMAYQKMWLNWGTHQLDSEDSMCYNKKRRLHF